MSARVRDTPEKEAKMLQTCHGCNGTGIMRRRKSTSFIITETCPGCGGGGKVDFEDPVPDQCNGCDGTGIVSTLAIPKFPKQGNTQIPCEWCQGCGMLPAGAG